MIYLMTLVLTTLAAGFAAYAGNRLAFRLLGCRATIAVVPWWEEGCKFAAILALHEAPIFTVHFLFGVVEFVHDVRRGESDGLFFPVLTLCGHGLFGSLALLAASTTGSIWCAYLAAAAAHVLFNAAVVYAILPTLGTGPYLRTGRR